MKFLPRAGLGLGLATLLGHPVLAQPAALLAPQPVTPRDGLCKGPVADATETLTFIPYGCTKLRVVALPVIP